MTMHRSTTFCFSGMLFAGASSRFYSLRCCTSMQYVRYLYICNGHSYSAWDRYTKSKWRRLPRLLVPVSSLTSNLWSEHIQAGYLMFFIIRFYFPVRNPLWLHAQVGVLPSTPLVKALLVVRWATGKKVNQSPTQTKSYNTSSTRRMFYRQGYWGQALALALAMHWSQVSLFPSPHPVHGLPFYGIPQRFSIPSVRVDLYRILPTRALALSATE